MSIIDMPEKSTDISLSHSAVIAGVALILMAILAPIAYFIIIQGLVVPGDAVQTAGNIQSSEGLFRLAIFFFLIVAILDIVVAWALYIFLRPVNRSLSFLTAIFRIVYAAVLSVILIFLVNILQLLSGADYLASIEANQLYAQVMLSLDTFAMGWSMGLVVFGIHLLFLGYLLLKAGYMRKILGILVVLASLGYLIDGLGELLFPIYNLGIAAFTFIGEVILVFWLLIWGRKIKE